MTQVRVSCEEGTTTEKILPPDWPVAKPIVNFLYE